MRTAEEIILEMWDASPDNIQLYITLNPDIEILKRCINEARKEAIKECAEVAETDSFFHGESGHSHCVVDENSILKLIDELK